MLVPMRLIAGPKAYAHIHHHGLHQSDLQAMLGASGGPKWFVLSHLDRYLAGEFFKERAAPLHLLGTSAGGWRFACYCQKDPVAATTRFIHHYANTIYTNMVNADEVTTKAEFMIDDLLGATGVEEIVHNQTFLLHLIVARARHFAASKSRVGQAAGLVIAAASNALSRKLLPHTFERLLFHSPSTHTQQSPYMGLTDYPTQEFQLSSANLREALMATGSIPIALHPRRYIEGVGQGSFIDGGITDYHFDLPIKTDGLVLYPHFYPYAIPGWFDKSLTWRRATAENFESTLLLCPSDSFVQSLPFSKLSDRNDFSKMPPEQRLPYWHTVIAEGEKLADFFAERVEKQDWMSYLELMN